jgi:F like protein
VSGPVWDGKGTDPWLPPRLYARAEAAQAERDIRRAVWAALSGWLVTVGRRVLRSGERPDAHAIHAFAPLWRDSVQRIVHGEIHKAFGLAYRRLLGDDFAWDRRLAASRYLTEVTNRMVRIPEEVFDLVAGQMSQGANLGEGIPKLAARVDTVLSTTESERWPNRATVVARTETIGALNAGRADAFRAFADERDDDEPELEKLWLATDDSRTRPHHREAEGQRVPVGQPFVVGGHELQFPGDPSGPAAEVIQCRCTMLLVEAGEDVDMSDRQTRRAR